jgi:hypothetical protein
MCLHVMNGQEGEIQCEGQGLGEFRPNQQGADQAGGLRKGDGREVFHFAAGFLHGGVHHGDDVLDMGAAGEFGDYAAVLLVDLLGGNNIGEDRSVPADRATRFVTGRFDGQDGHGLAHGAQNYGKDAGGSGAGER